MKIRQRDRVSQHRTLTNLHRNSISSYSGAAKAALLIGSMLSASLLPLTATAATFTASGMTFNSTSCSTESSTCTIGASSFIAFGANGAYTVKQFTAGAVPCTTKTFGDPIGGVTKSCYVATATTTTVPVVANSSTSTFRVGNDIFPATPCAMETGKCTLTGTTYVAFGAKGVFVAKPVPAGTFACANSTFGDPIAGIVKACYISTGAALDYSASTGGTKPGFTIGVGTHFGLSNTSPTLFKLWTDEAGIWSSRDEVYWDQVERADSSLIMRYGAALSSSVWTSVAAKARPVAILDYGHPKYDGGGQPSSQVAVEAYSRYAAWAAEQLAPTNAYMELWNEWNLKVGSKTTGGAQGAPADYVRLAASAYQAVKKVNPNQTVLVGALGDDFGWVWTKQAISLGLLKYADGLSLHLYNQCMNPAKVGADEMMQRLETLHELLTQAGYDQLPVFVTEVGWPTNTSVCGVSESDSGTHTVRFALESSTRAWLRGIWYYGLQDAGPDPTNWNHRFGLLRQDGSEKPSGCALRQVAATISTRPNSINRKNGVSAAIFKSTRGDLLAVWSDAVTATPSRSTEVIVDGSLIGGKVLDLCGAAGGSVVLGAGAKSAQVTVSGLKPVIFALPAGVNNVAVR